MLESLTVANPTDCTQEILKAAFPDYFWNVRHGNVRIMVIGKWGEQVIHYNQPIDLQPFDVYLSSGALIPNDLIYAICGRTEVQFSDITIEHLRNSRTIAEACIKTLLDTVEARS